ncbi:MAG: hypothetical protein KDA24_11180 [Deltaproteobacteria bacterium]|nr:hypothetical protein [Deltaproteobacteria bacterium]
MSQTAPRWLPGAGGEPDGFRARPGRDDIAHLSTGFDDDMAPDRAFPLPYGLAASAELLRRAGGELASLPVAVRIAGLSRVARSWLDPDDALRREAMETLPDELGFSPEMVAWALDAAFSEVTSESLQAWWARDGGAAAAGLSGHIWSGNVFVAGVPPVLGSLLGGVPALIKAPSAHPTFAALFARSVALHAPELGPCVGAAAWDRGDERTTRLLLEADVAYVFGDDATIAAVRELAPAGCVVAGFGHRISVGVVSGSVGVSDEELDGLLLDCLAYDGGGCLTPRWVFCAGGMSAAEVLARRAAERAPGVASSLPGLPLDDEAAAARSQYVGIVGFGGYAQAGAGWCVAAQDGLEPVPPGRTLCFVAVDALEAVPPLLAPLGDVIQGVVFAGGDLSDGLPVAGSLTRRAGGLQRPPLDWDHDGVQILEVLR